MYNIQETLKNIQIEKEIKEKIGSYEEKINCLQLRNERIEKQVEIDTKDLNNVSDINKEIKDVEQNSYYNNKIAYLIIPIVASIIALSGAILSFIPGFLLTGCILVLSGIVIAISDGIASSISRKNAKRKKESILDKHNITESRIKTLTKRFRKSISNNKKLIAENENIISEIQYLINSLNDYIASINNNDKNHDVRLQEINRDEIYVDTLIANYQELSNDEDDISLVHKM